MDFENRRRKENKTANIFFAAGFGLLLGALGGAALGASITGFSGLVPGAVLGGGFLAVVEGVLESRRKQRRPRGQVSRLFPGIFFGAAIGGLLSLMVSGGGVMISSLILGLISGLLEFQIRKILLAALVGLLVGLASQWLLPTIPTPVLGAILFPATRFLNSLVFQEEELVTLVGEGISASEARFVVPFEANSKQVGADYFRRLARTEDGAFKRNPPGIGIVESLDTLRGPSFDPALVNPMIRDFYEHTSRYSLAIRPEWRLRMKPFFWLFKRMVAQPMGQANLPFNAAESQEGIVSYIDTIDFQCNDIIDLRGWVRAFKDGGEAIYVGIYTTFRHENTGYVSVGFPLPNANFTATLLPYNLGRGKFLLKSFDTGLPYPGHYLSEIEDETRILNVHKLPTLQEEIEVYVQDGQLKTDHRFFLSGIKFLTLYYTIDHYDNGNQ